MTPAPSATSLREKQGSADFGARLKTRRHVGVSVNGDEKAGMLEGGNGRGR